MSYSLPLVLQRIEEIGGDVFTSGAYNLNLFGIRSPSRDAGAFDDLMGCAYRETSDGPWRVAYWPATTDPGVYWLENPQRVEGCAAMVADRQYKGLWKVGKHRGKYRALVQVGTCAVYRDDNRDRVLDYDPVTITEGVFGINGHKAGSASTVVGKWSAGCQVVAQSGAAGFEDMMGLVDQQLAHHPTWDRFTYTLLNQW
mgnify:FL=1|jgi:hypothetical protein